MNIKSIIRTKNGSFVNKLNVVLEISKKTNICDKRNFTMMTQPLMD